MPFFPRSSLPPINDPAPAGDDAAIAHGDLTGLTTGDPHTQYALADGSRGTFQAQNANLTALAELLATMSKGDTLYHDGNGLAILAAGPVGATMQMGEDAVPTWVELG